MFKKAHHKTEQLIGQFLSSEMSYSFTELAAILASDE